MSCRNTVNHWFWPSLAGGTQPDVVLRIGQRLLVIESKYGSNKSPAGAAPPANGDSDNDTFTSDQLLREWQAMQPEWSRERFADVFATLRNLN